LNNNCFAMILFLLFNYRIFGYNWNNLFLICEKTGII
jgi:hypothetical protein